MIHHPSYISGSRLFALMFAATLVCVSQQGVAQDRRHAFSWRDREPTTRIDLGDSILTPMDMGRWMLSRKESSAGRTIEAGDLESVLLGRRWFERESGLTAIWTRRGNSNRFDAAWSAPAWVTASLRITIDGLDRVEVVRRGSSDGNDCHYVGRFGARNGMIDATTVSGTYTCRNGGPYPWSASIDR